MLPILGLVDDEEGVGVAGRGPKDVGDREISLLVISDRYPPRSFGGAELSLHNVLRAVARRRPVLVVTLLGRKYGVRQYTFEGVDVIELPSQAPWPNHHVSQKSITRLGRIPGVEKLLRKRGAGRAMRRARLMENGEVSLLNKAFTRRRVRGGVTFDRQTYDEGLTRRMLRRMFHGKRIPHVHADNFRAICVADAVEADRRTYLVRDHRFACSRHDQSHMIDGQICTTCTFACAGRDAPHAAEPMAHLLAANHAYRLEKLKLADTIVTTSLHLQAALAASTERRIVRIPNPIDAPARIDRLVADVAEFDGFNMLVVGMLNENKGQADLVEMLAGALAARPSFRLHFAGRASRPVEARIVAAAAAAGISERVIQHGYLRRNPLYQLMRECQVVLLPTLWPEPFGRVPLEAGLVRRPVVAFAIGGFLETIVDGSTGYLVPWRDYDTMLARLDALAGDAALRTSMGEAARLNVMSRYGVTRVRTQFERLWFRSLATRGRASRPDTTRNRPSDAADTETILPRDQ